MGIEFQICKMKNVLEMGWWVHNVNECNTTELCTEK